MDAQERWNKMMDELENKPFEPLKPNQVSGEEYDRWLRTKEANFMYALDNIRKRVEADQNADDFGNDPEILKSFLDELMNDRLRLLIILDETIAHADIETYCMDYHKDAGDKARLFLDKEDKL
jgi:hypothetical protein